MADLVRAFEDVDPPGHFISEMTITELQAEISRLQSILHWKVAGDPRRVISTSFTSRLDTEGRWHQLEHVRRADGSCDVRIVNISAVSDQ